MASGRGEVRSGIRRADYGRPRPGYRGGGPELRQTAVQRLLSHMGNGHHPAHQWHAQCARRLEPRSGFRSAGHAGLRRIAAPRSEQRSRLWRRGLHSKRLPRISDHWSRHRREVPESLEQPPPAGGEGPGGDRHGRPDREGPDQGDVRHRREPSAQRARPAPRREGLQEARVPGRAGHLHARDGRDSRRSASGDLLRREGRNLHQQRAARPARPQGGRAHRPK